MRSDFYGLPYAAQMAIRRGEQAERRARRSRSVGYEDGFAAGIEAAAQWHDQRYRDTPDAFEMELHDASRKAIRALHPDPDRADEEG